MLLIRFFNLPKDYNKRRNMNKRISLYVPDVTNSLENTDSAPGGHVSQMHQCLHSPGT